MTTKHTPGPWHRNIKADGRYPVIFAGRNTHVAVAKQMPSAEETEANIDLIAAAPELLAALEIALDAGNIKYEGKDWRKLARAAIKLAKGE